MGRTYMSQGKNHVVGLLAERCMQDLAFDCKKHQTARKKMRRIRIAGLLLGIAAMSALSLSVSAFFELESYSRETASHLGRQKSVRMHQRILLNIQDRNQNKTLDPSVFMKRDQNHSKGHYPEDLFSLEQRRKGAVILHLCGMIYMFIALALACDEFFIPSLTVITEKLAISDDVAGATFMAAGGSAPELFTSVIGVFIAHSNVGIGTIVGSAVFNILFVIGICALFSKELLNLTWWPLFRDVTFYIMDLILLIIFFLDNSIMWWESLTLLSAYIAYGTFMKFNIQVEEQVERLLTRNKVEGVTPDSDRKSKPRPRRCVSSGSLHKSQLRNSIFQLMIYTLDPLAEGKFKERASVLHQMAISSQVHDGEKQNGSANHTEKTERPQTRKVAFQVTPPKDASEPLQNESAFPADEEAEEDDKPLSLAWPDTTRKRLAYLSILPIVLLLWITLPDVRNPKSKKFFPITFFGSISWIAIFSYLMVWWAHQVGETIGISEEIMGLTILAAGTSIPDLITSVIVARKGLGDMAVSSSVGSNIFDVTVGLPLPWLLFTMSHNFVPVKVSSNGLFCATVLLFMMLLFVIITIALSKWKMNKLLGFTMLGLYFLFLVLSVLLEDRIILCPVTV